MVPSARMIALITSLSLGAILCSDVGAAPSKNETITDAMVIEALTFALRNIHRGRCENEMPCAPATENELKNPPVPVKHARDAMRIGTVSGVAERCGIDWQSNFFAPMMKRFRHEVSLSQRQLTLIAFLHGMQQSIAYRSATDDMCTSALKRTLSNSRAR